MSKTTIEQTLKLIPSLFEINLNTDKSGVLIFEKLSKILDFDEAFIYFLNPESLQLKYCGLFFVLLSNVMCLLYEKILLPLCKKLIV